MPFLELKEGLVVPTEEGRLLPCVVRLYSSDKTEGKRYFNDCLMYIFFVYNQSGVYKDTFEDYRKKIVLERHLQRRKVEDFEGNVRVLEVINEYLERQLTKTERFLYQLEKDMDSLLVRISKIPYTKVVKAKIPYRTVDGDETMVTAEVEIDNSKEKEDAIRLGERMIDYADKLRAKVYKEKSESKKGSIYGRLFDKNTTI